MPVQSTDDLLTTEVQRGEYESMHAFRTRKRRWIEERIEEQKKILMGLLDEHNAWDGERIRRRGLRRALRTFKLPLVWNVYGGEMHVWIASNGEFYRSKDESDGVVHTISFSSRKLSALVAFNAALTEATAQFCIPEV